jgi:two-component system, chemotaxis family, chemotaxis protein CheY
MAPRDVQTGSAPTRTVLLVEDDEDTRVCLAELLEEHGYRVARARNGREAQDYLQVNPHPTCIVLDLWMPLMDGWTFAAEVASPLRPPVPLMVITAAESHWGYPTNPRYVLRKPLDSGKFLGMVDALAAA